MEIRVCSIKEANLRLSKLKVNNIKAIIISSCDANIDKILPENKLILNFDDITVESSSSFNANLAKSVHEFIDKINFEKYTLYVCCDSGVSRSSAVAACILRKYKEDENLIWKDYRFHPNILVYYILCKELGLHNCFLRLKYKMHINGRALRKKIKESRKNNLKVNTN